MTVDVRHHLDARPFEPFSIITTSSGSRYRVARLTTPIVNPRGTRTVVWFADDSTGNDSWITHRSYWRGHGFKNGAPKTILQRPAIAPWLQS